jgi:ribosomal protein S18 acetylase RimI-like enzyme
MSGLRVRRLTPAEFGAFRERAIKEYAAEHVRAGSWSESLAEELATKDTDRLLPDGVDTPGMLLLAAESAAADLVGFAWVALEHERTGGAYLYDIEIVPEQRGRGYGRALLGAVEREVEKRGCDSIALNVFAGNRVARQLYESSGYEITSLRMRKTLAPDSAPGEKASPASA